MATTAQEEFDELMRDKGRRSTHPEDDDARSFLDMSEDDDDDVTISSEAHDAGAAAPRPSMGNTHAQGKIPRTRFQANTGPKGVIADAQDWRDSRRTQQRAAVGGVSEKTTQQVEEPGVKFGDAEAARRAAERSVEDEHGEEDLDELDELHGDDEYMQTWRQNRLQELQVGLKESKSHNSGRNRRLFGGMTTVDGDGYLDAVDNSPTDVVVLVYIYDDQSSVSTSVERCLRALAGQYRDSRFVRLHFEDAQMEPAGVPALIAYRGGEKFAALVPLIDELPDDSELNAGTMEYVLKKHQILT